MAKPKISVLGVYALSVTDALVEEQADLLYSEEPGSPERAAAERRSREQLASTVLIEVLVQEPDDAFDVGDFSQSREGDRPSNSQVAWAEAFLATDGESLLVERWGKAPTTDEFRVAFFIHYWDPARPLRSSYGDLVCPPPQPMSERLQRLVPYELLD